MIEIDVSLITFPIPEPFDKTQPEKQRENLAFVQLQILEQFRDAVIDSGGMLDIDIVGALTALQFNHAEIRLGDLEIVLTTNTASMNLA